MSTVSTPVHAYVSEPLGGTANAASTWFTCSLNLPEAFDIRLNVQHWSVETASLPAQINAYLSKDGGTTFDSGENPYAFRQLDRTVSSSEQTTLVLPGGYWLFAVCNGTPSSSTVAIGTSQVHTAYVSN